MATTQKRNSSSSKSPRQNRYSSSASSSAAKSKPVRKAGGPGRGWHGDPEGHARAGRQSHKNDTRSRSSE